MHVYQYNTIHYTTLSCFMHDVQLRAHCLIGIQYKQSEYDLVSLYGLIVALAWRVSETLSTIRGTVQQLSHYMTHITLHCCQIVYNTTQCTGLLY